MKRSDLEWFLRHLDLDLEDRNLELDGISVEFYWDTVQVRQALLGMAAYYTPGDIFNNGLFESDVTLVCCLASAGWLDKIRLLQPHQAEFLKLLNADFGIGPVGPPRGGPKQFVNHSGLKKPDGADMRSLHEFHPNEIADVVKDQAGNAPTLFKVVHCALGTWKTRLASWVKSQIFELDTHKFDYGAIVGSDEFHLLKEAFDSERPESPVNNFADAAAICLLGEKLRACLNGEKDCIPRFFVSSPLYQRVITKTGLQRMVEYKRGENGVASLLRDSDYYKLRATFHPPKSLLERVGVYPKEFVESLHDARRRVSEILEAQRPLSAELVGTVLVGGRPLEEVIQNLRGFWFLENVWLPFAATTEIADAVKEYVETARLLEQSTEFKVGIDAAIRSTTETLEKNSLEYRRIGRLWSELKDATSSLCSSFGDLAEADIDLFKVFGLLRFGFPSKYREEIESLLRNLVGGETLARHDAQVALVKKYQSARSSAVNDSDVFVVVASFWALRMDRQLIDLQSLAGPGEHYSQRVVAAASRFRLRRAVNDGWQIIKSLEREVERTTDPDKLLDMSIGLAYLYFHYWQSQTDALSRLDQREADTLLDAAISFAKRAWTEIDGKDKQKKVYALNQYLYYLVHSSDTTKISAMHEAADQLLTLAGNNDVWQYRFYDTLAYYFQKRATLNKTRAKEALDEAKYYMNRAWAEAHGDEEVAKHRGKLEILLGNLEDSSGTTR